MPTFKWPSDVQGWLSPHEGERLAELAEGKEVLEIGSWHGLSTIIMGQVAKCLHSIDWGRGDFGTGVAWTPTILAENVKKYELLDRVILHVGRSIEVGKVLAPRSFDMAFIDGAHDRESAAEDMRIAARVVRPGGWIALHDWGSADVRAAARDALHWGHDGGHTIISLHDRQWFGLHPLDR